VILIHGRFAVALSFSAAMHAGLAWVASDGLPSSAAPAQQALSVALAPAAPRAVVNSIAPAATATLSPAVVQPLAPASVQAIDAPRSILVVQALAGIEALDAPLVQARGPEHRTRARDLPSSMVPVAIAPSETRITKASAREEIDKPLPPNMHPTPATSNKVGGAPASRLAMALSVRKPSPGKIGSGADARSPQAVAGRPGSNRQAVPASGNAPPEYPWSARARGHQGRVVLSVWVSVGGVADRLAVLKSSGHPTLDQAALEAVQHWRFQPARRGGSDTGSLLYVPVTFRLDDN
jgi:protein TonB